MQHLESTEGPSLSYYGAVLLRRWRLILAAGLIGLWCALALLWLIPQQATATTTVSLDLITNDPFNPSRSAAGLLDLEGETQVAGSAVVAERASSALGSDLSPTDVKAAIDVSGVPDTSILRVSATEGTPEDARSVADAVATEYLGYRSEQAQRRIDRTLESSRTRLEALRSDLADVTARESAATAAKDANARTQAEADRYLVTLEITSLLSEVATNQAIDTTAGAVLTPADSNPVTLSPPALPLLATGLLVGLGLGVLGAFLLGMRAGRVRSGRDLVNSGGHRFLGKLAENEVDFPPRGRDLEQHRAIRERLLADPRFSAQRGVLGVIDQAKNGAASDVSLGIAYAMAEVGFPVQFVGLGMPPELTRRALDGLKLEPDHQMGSSTVYVSRTHPNLTFVAPQEHRGTAPSDPVSRDVRNELLSRRETGVVVLGLPPGASEATSTAACRVSELVVLVASARSTSMSDVQRISREADSVGATIIGSILIGRRRSLAPSGGSVTPDAKGASRVTSSRV